MAGENRCAVDGCPREPTGGRFYCDTHTNPAAEMAERLIGREPVEDDRDADLATRDATIAELRQLVHDAHAVLAEALRDVRARDKALDAMTTVAGLYQQRAARWKALAKGCRCARCDTGHVRGAHPKAMECCARCHYQMGVEDGAAGTRLVEDERDRLRSKLATLEPLVEKAIEQAVDAALSEVRRQGGPEYVLTEAKNDGLAAGRRVLRIVGGDTEPQPTHAQDGAQPEDAVRIYDALDDARPALRAALEKARKG